MGDEFRSGWNLAIAGEVYAPLLALRSELKRLSMWPIDHNPALRRQLLSRLDAPMKFIENARLLNLAYSGDLAPRIQRCDVASCVDQVVDEMKDLLSESAFAAVVYTQPSIANCDPALIMQATHALLENARRYAIPCPLEIRVRVIAGACTVAVEDAGPFVPGDLCGSTERIYCGESRGKGIPVGSDFLAVVSEISKVHRGVLEHEVTARGGSLFEMRWPADVDMYA